MSLENIFENAVDATEYGFIPTLTPIDLCDLDTILTDQIIDYSSMIDNSYLGSPDYSVSGSSHSGSSGSGSPIAFAGRMRSPRVSSPQMIGNNSSIDDEVGRFINSVRQKRIFLGLTQSEMANSITNLCGKKISQTTVCRFEGKILPKRNLKRLKPTFEHWMALVDQNPAVVRNSGFKKTGLDLSY